MNELEQKQLPNATAVLVLGIISIISCCCYGIPGIILGITALILYRQDKVKYDLNPRVYSNFQTLNTGKILAIIGIILSFSYMIFIINLFTTIGWEALQDPEILQDRLNGW
ncbi:CCC motif membrane protein [Tenacibaculum sp. C7A-26P2]|uniref:CCC motif membrane protein n=1 Tax=Tenacibaculum sp. C7A-26P2 TaxID=3447504 RepID=UPI003F84E3D0